MGRIAIAFTQADRAQVDEGSTGSTTGAPIVRQEPSVPVRPTSSLRARLLGALTVGVLLAAGLAGPVGVALASSADAVVTPALSQGRTATASSAQDRVYFPPSAAVDGSTGTRWSSAPSDDEWLQVDLGASASVTSVVLRWEAAYARGFKIQVSDDAVTWTTLYTTTTGTGGTQTLAVSGSGRYVRMLGTARATGYGYSLWEMQVDGDWLPST
ncbi:MAG: discoidin domain-containing protein, partial [Cellulomonadaceae bacterium]|nr:discoidin domain-containing protein [Cellulomonadaceae bacterium]